MQSVPNYAWHPHKTNQLQLDNTFAIFTGAKTLAEAEILVPDYVYNTVDGLFNYLINDAVYLAIYSGLRHTTNVDVQGLANDRIPQGNTQDKTLSFLISYIHEKHLGILALIDKVKSELILTRRIYTIRSHNTVIDTVSLWTKRADKIADLTVESRSKVGSLAAKAEFIRNWALVDLKEKIGIEATAAANAINIAYTDPGNVKTTSQLLANQTMKVIKLEDTKLPPVGHRNNETDTLTITSRNGANFYNIKDSSGNWSSDVVLNKDISKTFTFAEATYGVRSRPIAPPTVYRTIDDQSLNVAVVQSVSLDTVFTGVLLTTIAVSDNEDIVTVIVTRDGNLAITGVSAGTATITVTSTNPSGAISTTFDVTVTEASGD